MKKKGLPSPDRADGLAIANYVRKFLIKPRVLREVITKEEEEFYKHKKGQIRTVQSIINKL